MKKTRWRTWKYQKENASKDNSKVHVSYACPGCGRWCAESDLRLSGKCFACGTTMQRTGPTKEGPRKSK